MMRWCAGVTAGAVALIWVATEAWGIRSPWTRGLFWAVLAFWQAAMVVALYVRTQPRSRADCLGVATVATLVVIAYVLIRYPRAWPAAAIAAPAALLFSLAGGWATWRALTPKGTY